MLCSACLLSAAALAAVLWLKPQTDQPDARAPVGSLAGADGWPRILHVTQLDAATFRVLV
jgi:hypothetical protein